MHLYFCVVVFTALFSWTSLYAKSLPQENNNDTAMHLSWRDTHVSPGTNFFAYANGQWQKQNPIPPAYPSWSVFAILEQKTQKILHEILINASTNRTAVIGSIEQKVGDFYYSGMDETSINKLGIEPLKPEFERIQAIKNRQELQEVIALLHRIGVGALFNFDSMQDYKDSKKMIGVAMQGGLGLPDRDYYLKDDAKFKQIRAAYLQHIAKMLVLAGDLPSVAAAEADTVMAIETTLAKYSLSQTAQRDPHAVYHPYTLAQLKKLTPDFSWSDYFKAMGQPQIKHINMAMPDFFKSMNTELTHTTIDAWKIYLRWHLLDTFAPYLSKPFVLQNFEMVSVLTGAKKLLPRWRRVVGTENQALGFAVGKLYVDKYFSFAAKQEVLTMLKTIRQVLRDDLQTLPWMTATTRKAALHKLSLIEERVGYPDKWWDYSKLLIDRGPYVLNVSRSNQFLIMRSLNKIGKPVDRSEWSMTPQTINAYYDPSMNNSPYAQPHLNRSYFLTLA